MLHFGHEIKWCFAVAHVPQSSCSLLNPYHLNMGPWPAVARKRLNPARGPGGPELALALPEAFSSPQERGAAAPAADHRVPSKSPESPAFYSVFCYLSFSHFSEFVAEDGSTWANIGLKMGRHSIKRGQHSPQDGPTSPRDGFKMGEHSLKRGQHSPQDGPT